MLLYIVYSNFQNLIILYIIIRFTYNYEQLGLFIFKIGAWYGYSYIYLYSYCNMIQIRCPKPLFQVYERNTNNSDA